MEEMQNNQIRLEWLEEQVNHYQAELDRVQADIDQLEGVKAQYSNYLDGFKVELAELSAMQFELV